MSASEGSILIASADRLFAEAVARFLERRTGRPTLTERDGIRALMAVTRLEPAAVIVLGSVDRLPTDAFARRLRTRWPSIHLVILGSEPTGGVVALPEDADGAAVLAALSAPSAEPEPMQEDVHPGQFDLLQSLTRQEKRILLLLGQGMDLQDIARRLAISEHTVRTHQQNLYRKLGVHSRLEVTRLIAQHGLVRTGSDETD